MERTKLKLAVIFLLVVINLLLLGNAGIQHRQNILYTRAAVTETMTYLERRGVKADREIIPWVSTLPDSPEKIRVPKAFFLIGDPMPEGESCSIRPSLRAETLAVDMANGFAALGLTDVTVESIDEGYRYDGMTRTLEPLWRVKTDRGSFLLHCGDGTLSEN